MPHGGFVIRTGETGRDGNKHVIEYSLKLDSNPEFTANIPRNGTKYRLAELLKNLYFNLKHFAGVLLSI